MATRKQVPILDMGAAFISAVLADNERLRKAVDDAEKRETEKRLDAERRADDYRRIIALLVFKMGGDVHLETNDRRMPIDDRRLIIDRADYGRIVTRVRLVDDEALGILNSEAA